MLGYLGKFYDTHQGVEKYRKMQMEMDESGCSLKELVLLPEERDEYMCWVFECWCWKMNNVDENYAIMNESGLCLGRQTRAVLEIFEKRYSGYKN